MPDPAPLDLTLFEHAHLESWRPSGHPAPVLPDGTPPGIRQLYVRYGLCSFMDGFVHLIDPAARQHEHLPWFRRIEQRQGFLVAEQTYPFLQTAFGDVFFYGSGEIGLASVSTLNVGLLSLQFLFTAALNEEEYLQDVLFRGMYQRRAPQERPGPGQILGFMPPYLDIEEVFESFLQVVDRAEHLALLARLMKERWN